MDAKSAVLSISSEQAETSENTDLPRNMVDTNLVKVGSQTKADSAVAGLKQESATVEQQTDSFISRGDSLGAERETSIYQLGLDMGIAEEGSSKEAVTLNGQNYEYVKNNYDRLSKINDRRKQRQGVDQAPVTGAMFNDPKEYAQVEDDVDQLSDLEKIIKDVKNKFETGNAQVDLANAQWHRMWNGEWPGYNDDIEGIRKRMSNDRDDLGFWGTWPGDVAGQLPILYNVAVNSLDEAMLGGTSGAVVGGIIGGPPGAAAGFIPGIVAGGTLGMGKESGKLEASLAYDEYLQITDKDGTKMDPDAARVAAMIVGTASGALEVFGFSKILKAMPGGEKVISQLTREKMRKMLKAPTVREALTNLSKKVGVAALAEGSTEALQEVIKIIGGQLLKQSQEGEYEGLDAEQEWGKVLESFEVGAKVGSSFAMPGALAQNYINKREGKKAEQRKSLFEALGEHSINAKTRDRLPDKFKKFIKDVVEKHGAIKNVLVDNAALKKFFQDSDIGPEMLEELMPETFASLQESEVMGTYVEIPLDEFVTYVAPSDLMGQLYDDMKFSPDEMTANEIKDSEIDLKQQQTEWDKKASRQEMANESGEPIFTNINEQLMDAGYTSQTAAPMARVIQAGLSSFDKRTQDAVGKKFSETLDINIRNEEIENAKGTKGYSRIEAMLDSLREGKTPTSKEQYGPTLIEFLIQKGGLLDQGGELSAQDLDKAQAGYGRKKIARPDGMTFESAYEIAVEEGYLPDGQVGEQAILEAIDNEMKGGEPLYAAGREDTTLIDLSGDFDTLQDMLNEAEIDLQDADNKTVFDKLGIDRLFQVLHKNKDLIELQEKLDNAGLGEKGAIVSKIKAMQETIIELNLDRGIPAVAQNKKGDLWQMFHLATSGDKKYQVTTYNESGALGDSKANSVSELLDDGQTLYSTILDDADASEVMGQVLAGEQEFQKATRKLSQNNKSNKQEKGINVEYKDTKKGKVDLHVDGEFVGRWDTKEEAQGWLNTNKQFAPKQTGLPEQFFNWFKQSEVVDDSGKPLVVYHGTGAKVKDEFIFDYSKIGEQGRAEGGGFYFTENKNIADGYAGEDGTLLEVYLSIQDPIEYNQAPFEEEQLREVIVKMAELEAEQYEQGIGDGYLSNYGDVNYEGLDSVINMAVEGVANEETALDQLGGFIGSGVDVEHVNKAVFEATGHDGVKSEGFSGMGGDNLWVAFFPEQVKSVDNKGRFNPANTDIYNQFVGEKADTADMLGLFEAKEMIEKGESTGSVRRKTGWFKGVDGRWRFEISDDKAEFIVDPAEQNKPLRLDEIVSHDELFKAYPDMAGMQVSFVDADADGAVGGVYDIKSDSIEISRGRDNEQMLSTLLHEIQHAIQEREDFSRGGNPDFDFTQSIRRALANLEKGTQKEVEQWEWRNDWDIQQSSEAAERARHGLMFESAERLIDYSKRDNPGQVFRHIRNETQWLYDDKFKGDKEASELQRRFYDLPKRHKKAQRDQFIREMAFDIAQLLKKYIPDDAKKDFKNDPRTMKGMLNALNREANKARGKLAPLKSLKSKAKAAEQVTKSTKYKTPFDIYRSLGGEIEARTTQARQSLTKQERADRHPSRDEDVRSDEAIIIVGGMEIKAPDSMLSRLSQDNKGTERGYIDVDRMRRAFTITMTGKANLSTFLHESGHLFLETLILAAGTEGADPSLQEDLNKVYEWFGVEPGSEITTEQHEQFARGFEAYLMEGKAPIPELQAIFDRFKAWLINVYKQLKALNVTLDDEIRGVFDRILVADAAIDRSAATYEPIFESAKDAGMSDAQYKSYVNAHRDAITAAQNELERELIQDYRASATREYNDKKKLIRVEVEGQINKEPVYAVQRFIRSQKLPVEYDVPESLVGKRIDSSVVYSLFPNSKIYSKMVGLIAKANGEHPDNFAGVFGFSSGYDMIQSILDAQPRAEVIDERVQVRMDELYGDILKDGNLEEKAIEDLHENKMGNFILAEARALGKKSGKDVKQNQTSIARNAARSAVRDKATSKLNAQKHLHAERKHGKLAREAVAKGEFEQATEHKMQQLLNHYMYSETKAALAEMEKMRTRLKRYDKKSVRTKIGKASREHLDSIDTYIDSVDLRKIPMRSVDRRMNLAAWIAEKEAEGDTFIIDPKLRDTAFLKNYRLMSLNEFQGLFDAVENIATLATLKSTLMVNKERRDKKDVMATLDSLMKKNVKKPKVKHNFLETFGSKAAERAEDIVSSLTKMEFIAKWIDGEAGGYAHDVLIKPFSVAQTAKFDKLKHIFKGLEKIFDTYDKKDRKRLDETVMVMGQQIKRRDVIAIVLNMGNEGNLNKLLKGHGWDHHYSLLLENVQKVLIKKDFEVAQKIWNLIDSLWPETQAVYARTYGVPPDKVIASPLYIEKFDLHLKGGYYPVVYDRRKDVKAEEHAQKKESLFSDNFTMPGVNRGFTKERTGYIGPIKLNLDAVASHINETVHFITHFEAVMQADSLTRDPAFVEPFKEYFGNSHYHLIKPWLQSIAKDGVIPSDKDFIDNWARHARIGMSMVAMGLSGSTMIMQGFGLFTTVDEIGLSATMRGMLKFAKNPGKAWNEGNEKSGELRHAINVMDREIAQIVNKQFDSTQKQGLGHLRQFAFMHIGLMQKTVNMATWHGAYEKAQTEGKNEEDSIFYADSVTRISQSAAGVKDLAKVQQGTELKKMILPFYTYFSVMFNRQRDMWRELNKEDGRAIPSAKSIAIYTYRSMWMIFLPVLFEGLMRDKVPDEDDEESMLAWWATQSFLYAFTGIPLLRDLVGGIGSDYGANPAPALAILDKSAVAVKSGFEFITNEDDEFTDREAKAMAEVFGLVFHLPTKKMYQATEWAMKEDSEAPIREFIFGVKRE